MLEGNDYKGDTFRREGELSFDSLKKKYSQDSKNHIASVLLLDGFDMKNYTLLEFIRHLLRLKCVVVMVTTTSLPDENNTDVPPVKEG